MFGSSTKYRDLTVDPIDGVPITWRAHPDGYPIRAGDSPPIIEKARLAQAGFKLFARSKCFTIPDEIDQYTATIDWIANTNGVLRKEEEQQIEGGKWKVWLVWFDVRGTIPKDSGPGAMK